MLCVEVGKIIDEDSSGDEIAAPPMPNYPMKAIVALSCQTRIL
jgi:hypothetical protein